MKTAEAAFDVASVRTLFPALERKVSGKRLVYLDSACTALKSRAVEEAVSAFYASGGACGGKRSTHLLAQEVEEQVSSARQAAADFLGAETPSEIVFTSGTTEAANLVAGGFPYGEGRSEVVLSDLEHNAVFLPFYEAARRGEVALKLWRSRDGRLDPDDLKALVGERTALVCVTRASNVAGGVQPVAQACRIAHAAGARVFCDDAQFVATHQEDVSALNVDFAAFSAHKIGGPFGLGVLFGKEQELNRLRPWKTGGGTIKSIDLDGGAPSVRYLDAPARLEAGVQNYGAFAGLSAAIRLLSSLPQAALRAHVAGLVRRAVAGILQLPQLRLVGRPQDLEEGAIVSFYPIDARFSVADFNLYLNHELEGRFVALRCGEHCAHLLHKSLGVPATIRASFFAYNTAEEVDAFLDALKAYVREACS